MTTVEIKPNVRVNIIELLDSLSNLATPELEKFIGEAGKLLVRREKTSSSLQEEELLLKIKNAIPASVTKRYKQLHIRLSNNTITNREYEEIRQTTAFMEDRAAQRVRDLAQLASLRKSSVPQLMEQLGMNRRHATT